MQKLPTELLRGDSPKPFSVIPVESLDPEIPKSGKVGVVDSQMAQYHDDHDIRELAKNIKDRANSASGRKISSTRAKKPVRKTAQKGKPKSRKVKKPAPSRQVHKRRGSELSLTSDSDLSSEYSSESDSSFYSSSSESDSEELNQSEMARRYKRSRSSVRRPLKSVIKKRRTKTPKSTFLFIK